MLSNPIFDLLKGDYMHAPYVIPYYSSFHFLFHYPHTIWEAGVRGGLGAPFLPVALQLVFHIHKHSMYIRMCKMAGFLDDFRCPTGTRVIVVSRNAFLAHARSMAGMPGRLNPEP